MRNRALYLAFLVSVCCIAYLAAEDPCPPQQQYATNLPCTNDTIGACGGFPNLQGICTPATIITVIHPVDRCQNGTQSGMYGSICVGEVRYVPGGPLPAYEPVMVPCLTKKNCAPNSAIPPTCVADNVPQIRDIQNMMSVQCTPDT
jgi:hypothetical protein